MGNLDFGAESAFSAPKWNSHRVSAPSECDLAMNQERSRIWGKWILSACGLLTVLYCLTVLGFVATAPDLGLRCLLVNDQEFDGDSSNAGLQIRQVIHEPASEPQE